MKIPLSNAASWFVVAAGCFAAAPYAIAHGIDERPGLGTGMTIFLSVFWIVIAILIVYIVRRLIKSGADKQHGREDSREGEDKDLS